MRTKRLRQELARRLAGVLLVLALTGLASNPFTGPMSADEGPVHSPEPTAQTQTGSPVKLPAGSFVPTSGESLDIPQELQISGYPEGIAGYYIVQFQGPIHEEWKRNVALAGGTVLDYMPDFSFVVYMDQDSLEAVQAMPEVVWIGLFQPAYRLSPDLYGSTGTLDLMVHTFPTQPVFSAAAKVETAGAEVQDVSQGTTGGLMRLEIESSGLKELAHVPSVRWIEPFHERVLFNDVSRSSSIMDGEAVWNNLGLYGAGQIVAVADTGLDTGSTSTLHADFRGTPTGCTGTSRIVATFARGRTNDWSDSCQYLGENRGGHGTHVAGSVLGNGCQSGSSGSPDYSGSHAGLAPQAGLVFQSIMDSNCALGGLPNDLNDLFSQAKSAGARIHTNSWGSAVNGTYTTDSYNVDEYSWNNKDFTILFAAGNEGTDANADGYIDADSINAPGTAKNTITVGASENYRLYGGVNPEHSGDPWNEVQCSGNGGGPYWGNCWPTDFGTLPISTDRVSDNLGGMVAFSSRGPTNDGRIKPDVVAPGSNILSTKSQATYVGTGWGAGENQYYQFMGGTSMATPLTAGAVALVRDFYTDVESHTPSSALLKASLINSAVNMHPGQYGSPLEHQPQLPNGAQGWGRVHVGSATDGSHSYEDVSDPDGLSTGSQHQYSSLVCSAEQLKVTLVWTDFPGSSLVNDLDLVLTAPDGTTVYLGNVFGDGASTTGGTADRVNNVESVYIDAPPPGTWTVTVSGYNVPNGASGKQDYALVVDMPGNICDTDFTLDATPASQSICSGDAAAYDVALGSISGFNSSVTLSTSGNPGSASFSPNPATPPAGGTVHSTLTINGATLGSHSITVSGSSGVLNHQDDVDLDVYAGLPGAVTLTAPGPITGQSTQPTLSWQAAANTQGYDVDVATDPDFDIIVDSATGLPGTSFTPASALSPDTIYYWRVRANNPCGSMLSSTSAFRTEAMGCTVYGPGAAGNIADSPVTTVFPLNVAGSGTIVDVNVLDLVGTHTWIGDLDFELESPSGTRVQLIPRMCSNADDFDRDLDDEATNTLACPLNDGQTQRPSGSLADFDGEGSAGAWNLRITDNAGLDTGALESWYLEICAGTTATAADYSDLSSGYGIAWHTGNGALRLGSSWTADTSFGPGDDNGSDDGIAFPSGFLPGVQSTVRVDVQGTPANGRWLRLWFDWDDDGTFDESELVYNNSVNSGINNISVNVPAQLVGTVHYRARLYDSSDGTPTIQARDGASHGLSSGGEVEDGSTPFPTSLTLARFEALPRGTGILLEWETASEIDLVGFNVYRQDAKQAERIQLNESLIESKAPGMASGAGYSWVDNSIESGRLYQYELGVVTRSGQEVLYGPEQAATSAQRHLIYLPIVAKP